MRSACALVCVAALTLTACASGGPLAAPPAADQGGPAVLAQGRASWYGLAFHDRKTASGEKFDMNAFTAAHPTLPFGTLVLVRNPANGRSVVVRVNDRGPYSGGRIIDLSFAAARALGIVSLGTRNVVLMEAPPGAAPGPVKR